MNAIIGRSDWASAIRQQIRQLAEYSSSVLVTGPTGTGKELIARAIHSQSRRASAPFVPVDCASIQGELFASHLFGHVVGAFTGANHARLGCFRAADGGTLFLDELGELSLELQAKLLRTLQERTVIPVGSEIGIPVDVRVIAATNRDLAAEVAAGRFRQDLYYRLNVISLRTLALCERPDDIEMLAEHCLDRLAIENGLARKTLSAEAVSALRSYEWPGNVRELQNAVERAVVFTMGEVIHAAALPRAAASTASRVGLKSEGAPVRVGSSDAADEWSTLAAIERDHIWRTLEHTYFNRSAAARLLNIDRASLARKIKQLGIAVPAARRGRPANDASRRI